MNLDNFISKLDTDRFGFKIAKIESAQTNIFELLPYLNENGIKLCICKVSLEKLDILNLLEGYGFVIKDIQVTYKFDMDNPIPKFRTRTGGEIKFRDAKKKDIVKLVTIAKDTFSNYGHYAADNKLPFKKVGDIYGDWIRRSIEEKGVADKIILAELNNEIAGFLSFKIEHENNIHYAKGGLGCVVKKFRNQNIFRLLTIKGLEWGEINNLSWEEHNVVITNYPVNSSFSKLGFKICRSFATLHYWI